MKQPPALLLTGAFLPAVVLLASGIASQAQTQKELDALTAHLPQPEDLVILPTAAETEEYLKNLRESKLRTLASDPDGWDDLEVALWKARDKNYVFEPGNKTKDTDGDGLSDYQEMLLNRDATFAEPVLTKEQQIAQIREGRRQAIRNLEEQERTYQKALAAAKPFLRELIPAGQLATAREILADEQSRASLRLQAALSALTVPGKERALDILALKYGVSREFQDETGKKLKLAGEFLNTPVFIGSHDTLSAAGISADELWPLQNNAAQPGYWPWGYAESTTGLNLTGAGQTLGLWEVDGGVRTSHIEMGTSRVTQKDSAAIDTSHHATNVAGTMAGTGAGTVFGSFYESRGVAYQANVFAYETNANFKSEREDAVAGVGTDPPLRLSNHSWGLSNGWRRENINPGGTANYQWVWYGFTSASFQEDPKFGLYISDLPGDNGCTQIDSFLQSQAPQHLMVYSCGNDRGEGPAASPGTYYYRTGNTTWTSVSAASFPRDWDDGDEGYYDTVASPGTAKNVLTVGSCEDVYRVSGSNLIIGFGTGAVVTPSAFSGAGPTDDGRIKPDLVAVGSPAQAIREPLNLMAVLVTGQPKQPVILGPASNTDTAYSPGLQGTSFSAPAVTGALGLAQQRQAQLYPSLPAAQAWRGSTLKGIAINTCDDVGAEGPDYKMGYGVMNAKKAAELVGRDATLGRGSLIKEFTLTVNQSVSWCVTSNGTQPLCVTVPWTDPPGPAPTTLSAPDPQTAMLVNNIDLKVEKLSDSTVAETFLPWVLNPDLTNKTATVRSTAATRGTDNRNNVEKVSIAAPAAGRYRITVTHAGGITGNPAASTQAVSAVLSGVVPELPQITTIVRSATPGQYLLTYTGDAGAYFTIQTSTNLSTWTDSGSVLTAAGTNSVVLNTGTSDPKRFWRLKRGQ